jgi:hypothetical protein
VAESSSTNHCDANGGMLRQLGDQRHDLRLTIDVLRRRGEVGQGPVIIEKQIQATGLFYPTLDFRGGIQGYDRYPPSRRGSMSRSKIARQV